MFGKHRRRRRAAKWVVGALFVLGTAGAGFAQQGHASYYGPGFYGNTTACGDTLTYEDWTVAHRSLPCGQKMTVCYRGECARGVTVTDRGPAAGTGRTLDLNMKVAERLGLTYAGHGKVTWWQTGYDPNYANK
jgi:rare lipoprotein A